MAVADPKPAGDPGCDAVADHLHLYPGFYKLPTGINQVRTFVGLGNYLAMLKDQLFWDTIGRTMYFTVASVGLEMLGGMAIAQLIHSHPWGWKFLRFSLIIPGLFRLSSMAPCGAGSTMPILEL